MKNFTRQTLVVSGLLFFQCTPDHGKSDELIQANNLHLESIAIAENLEEKLVTLRKDHRDPAVMARIDSLLNVIEAWQEAVIEVPGFKHHHEHHEHKPAPEMTDQSMLDYQKNAKEAIMEVSDKVGILAPMN
ncbi:hypothetical protein [Dyadobacter aurulentus]|uniref:hypothetical protein n=1 Tax=Dyadobacter sp. UC 10 TaxID=2605428 RepID=UPI0011F24B2B|nr:hypothetical protein [Dyadobacter sp. UC 10]KAA0992610.1 hypothetical protein FXO21_21770 [Dyadobacter sp. UC 10]